MFNIFKRKQQYVNIFMTIIFSRHDTDYNFFGTGKVRWPVNIKDLEKVADELAIMRLAAASSQNYTNMTITSICVISDVYS